MRECKLLTNPVRVHKQLAASSKVELGKTTRHKVPPKDRNASGLARSVRTFLAESGRPYTENDNISLDLR